MEPFGIDESWQDVTHTLHLFGGDAKALADTLRSRVKRELGLTLSVGVSFNKVFAKLGSDYKKPDATTVISPENWREIVWPLPAGATLFVGGAAQKILRKYGMETIGQMAACKRETLETIMGKLGTQLYEYEYANDLDESPVKSRYETEPVKSVGNGTTFSFNLTKRQQIADGIAMLTGEVASRLRHSGLYAGGVQVTVRDPEFHDRSRQRQLSVPTYLFRDLRGTAMELVNEIWKPPSPVRALRVTAINLVPEDETFEQVDLFASAASREQQERPESAMASIRDKYGNRSIAFGGTQRLGRSDEND